MMSGVTLGFIAFNRTIVELKWKYYVSVLVDDGPFNRTIVELK